MDLQQMPKNDSLWTALNIYRPSNQTFALKSEKNRTIFAEHLETSRGLPLSTLCLKVIAENHKGGSINLDLKPIQWQTFYDHIDAELALEKCINIDDEYYWKRVYALKCTDKMLLKRKTSEKEVCWKNLAVTLKYVEMIETTPYEIWVHDEMEKITKMVSPYVTELKISKLQAMRDISFQKQPLAPKSSSMSTTTEEEATVEPELKLEGEEPIEYDYPIHECHHVNLSVLRNLLHLHSLIVEFLPPQLGIGYHSRYFNFSYMDMQNLASGISELTKLRVFKIRRSRMDCVKLSTILEALKSIFVEHLEFYFCQLDDECGECLYEFLISTATLKHFNICGNYFRNSAINYLSNGIHKSASKLRFLGLSNNPISDDSLCDLITILMTCEQLAHVTLSGIKMSQKGATCVANLIKGHPNLEILEIIAVPMDGYTLIDAMERNTKIQQIFCQGCGFTLEEDFKIELLLKRNRYIKKNPYIGDTTKTEQEINDFVTKIKNPILTNCLAEIKRRAECCRKQAERDKSPSEQSSSDSEKSKEFRYKSKQFTEDELDQRVTLYGQNVRNFFKEKSPSEINQ